MSASLQNMAVNTVLWTLDHGSISVTVGFALIEGHQLVDPYRMRLEGKQGQS